MGRKCFIPGCKSGYHSQLKRSIRHSIFQPCSAEQLENWRRVIPRTDKLISSNDVVCELHFEEEDIERYYETLLSDGTLFRLKRGRPCLKKRAIPTIFPNLPTYSHNIRKIVEKMKSDYQFTIIDYKGLDLHKNKLKEMTELDKSEIEESKELNEIESIRTTELDKSVVEESRELNEIELSRTTEHSRREVEESTELDKIEFSVITELNRSEVEERTEQNLSGTEKFFTFNELVKNLDSISKPNALWGVTAHDTFVIFAKWSEDHTLKKRLIIDSELKVQVFLEEAEISSEGVVSSIEEVSSLLKDVDSFELSL